MKRNFLFLSMLLACSLAGFAQDGTYAGTPFNGPHTVPCTVEAEDFDNGGEGVAYHRESNQVQNNAYREGENVYLEVHTYGDVINVGSILDGEWLKYTIEVPEAGDYAFDFTWASWNSKTFTVSIDDESIGTYTIPTTGGFGIFLQMGYFNVYLQEGIHVVTVFVQSSLNFDKFRIRRHLPYTGTPYNGTLITIPEMDLIEAEHFDEGIYEMTYYVTDIDEGGEKNSIRKDVSMPIRNDDFYGDYIILSHEDWAAYSFKVSQTNVYKLIFTTNAAEAEGKLSLFLGYIPVGTVTIHPSEDWNYLVELPEIVFEEGDYLLKIVYEGTGQLSFSDIFVGLASEEKNPTYIYDFNDPTDLTKPTLGDVPLEFYQIARNPEVFVPDASGIQAVAGPKAGEGAIFVPANRMIKVNNPEENGLLVYSLLWDIKAPDVSDYNSLFQLDPKNNDDGELFIYGGKIGQGSYSDVIMEPDTWHRVIYVSNGDSKKAFFDGELIRDDMSTNARFQIQDYFWLFGDEDATPERKDIELSQFVFWAGSALNILDLEEQGYAGNPTAIKKVETSAGKVYGENGKLHVEGYSASASVEVYNLVGQKIAAAKSLNGNTINVSKGLYIVRVIDKGKSVSYKVIVK